MAKQTFTTGQVLTAAQMTSLQQTAMGGGEATAKTASYVLVAADAGTTIIMNAAGATTITVNTALFAAGDTVNIQNIGAGVCTITNGTATVSTAGSLALSQWEGGVLYFRSTSTATFFDYVQTGAVSPLTTKGDIWGYSTLDARIPIGTNNQVLTADSAQALGLKWATPATPSTDKTFALISTTATTSGSTVTISGLSGDIIYCHLTGVSSTAANASLSVRLNGDTGTKYSNASTTSEASSTYSQYQIVNNNNNGIDSLTSVRLAFYSASASSEYAGVLTIFGAASTTGVKPVLMSGSPNGPAGVASGQNSQNGGFIYTGTTPAAITSISFILSSGTFDAGSISIYKG